MSLVDYSDASSDEDENECEEREEEEPTKVIVPSKKLILPPAKTTNGNSKTSDEENEATEAKIHSILPPPKHQIETTSLTKSTIIEEQDDEFLRKKAVPSEPPPKPKPIKGPVKITIPSLTDFKDDELDIKKVSTTSGPEKGSSLLRMLPQPKTERSFVHETNKANETNVTKKVTSLVPDSVKKHQAALKKGIPVPSSSKKSVKVVSNDQNSDDEQENNEEDSFDFFSLDKQNETLPEVSSNEIALMVAKRAAKMAEVKSAILKEQENLEHEVEETQEEITPQQTAIDQSAVQQLIGGNKAKRARLTEEMNIIEISDADIRPNREEFLRTQLTRQTQFVPTGKLEGYDSTAKRNSQITKLAQRALANEQELEAMWAANRQNKRAAHSKYGF